MQEAAYSKEGLVKRNLWTVVAAFGILVLTGRAGTGETVMLNLHAAPPGEAPQAAFPAKILVVVADFEDGRPDKQRAGARVHRGGAKRCSTCRA